jgi:hypothetical protein
MDLLSAIICLLGDIINAFIDFIWALMGLRPILEPPHVKICQDTNKAIINSKMQPNTSTQSSSIESQLTSSNSNSSKQLDKYAYNITLPDGTYLTGLTYDQLLTYLNIHKDLQFNFNF